MPESAYYLPEPKIIVFQMYADEVVLYVTLIERQCQCAQKQIEQYRSEYEAPEGRAELVRVLCENPCIIFPLGR